MFFFSPPPKLWECHFGGEHGHGPGDLAGVRDAGNEKWNDPEMKTIQLVSFKGTNSWGHSHIPYLSHQENSGPCLENVDRLAFVTSMNKERIRGMIGKWTSFHLCD